jgi:SNF2 family DNA or RNA helicase
LEKIVNEFKETNIIPTEYIKKQLNNQSCRANVDCRSVFCYEGVCKSNPEKTNLKPLYVTTKLNLKKEDKVSNVCYNLSNLELKPHQIKVTKFMRDTNQKGILLLHKVGSGKTITSLITAKCILSKYPKIKVVILTPSSVVKQFGSELKRLNLSPEMESRFDIYSHQMWLDRFEAKMVNAKNTVLIVDEAHKFKSEYKHNGNVVTGKYVNLLNKAALQSFKIILLTATPVENDIKEIRNYLAMIDNKSLQEYYKDVKGQFEKIKDIDVLTKDYTHLLKCKISYHKNTSPSYPMKIEKNVRITMTKPYYKLYKQVETLLFEDDDVKRIFQNDFDKIPDINKFYSGIRRSVNKIKVMSPKLRWVVNKVVTNPNTKILIYSSWLEFGVNVLMKQFNNLNIKYKTIQGDVSQDERGRIVKEFNEHQFSILLITSAGAEGLDLKGTRHVILLEPFWHQSRIDQVVGRAIRYRSHIDLPLNDRNVTVYNLMLVKPNDTGPNEKESADEIMFKMSKQKCSIIDQFYDQIKMASIENQEC